MRQAKRRDALCDGAPMITVERREAALWLTLDRASDLNALSPQMAAEIAAALDEAERDPDVRALVVTGRGRAFCAGADLKAALAFSDGGDPAAASTRFLGIVGDVLNRLEAFPKPTVAAVNGIALAAGLEIMLCCDLVVAADTARIGDGHAKYGLIPGGGASARLPRRIGATRAKELMFTADLRPAVEMMAWGLLNEVVPAADLYVAVDRLLARIIDKSPVGLARMKALLNDAVDQPLSVALRAEIVASELHVHSHDRNEGLAAFADKRPPRFTGR